jgi:hypothetical protein
MYIINSNNNKSKETINGISPSSSSLKHGKRNISESPLKISTLIMSYIENSPLCDTQWLRVFLVIFISVKMQMLFEHSVCFFSLAATRYITTRHRRSSSDPLLESRDQDNIPLRHTASYGNDNASETGIEISAKNYQSFPLSTPSNDCSFRQPSAVYLSEDSQHSSCCSTSQSLQDLASRGSDSPSFLSSKSPVRSPFKSYSLSPDVMEDEVDEWGHFADIHDETQSKCSDSFDPFRSITKTMMRKRGQTLSSSLCRLSKLQENILEEEQEEDDEE